MKAKTILAAVFTALCLVFCILNLDLAMYLTGLIALVIIGLDDLKIHSRFFRRKIRKTHTTRAVRKEVVSA